LTIKRLKHSTNFEYAENVRSSNVVERECELHYVPNMNILIFRTFKGSEGQHTTSIFTAEGLQTMKGGGMCK